MAISSKKLLGSKGGPLAVRPKINLVPFKSKGSSIIKVGEEDPMLVIKTKVIKIEDILKGTLAAEKKAADEKRKAQEKEDRSKQEEEIEADPKSKEKGIKLPIPKKVKSWWQAIKKFFTTVLLGWLAVRLMKWLPKLKPLLSALVGFSDFLINWGGKILNALVTFIDWGYKAVTATEGWIRDKFGDGAAEKFNSFTGILTKTMNLVMALGIAAGAMMGGGKQKGPKGKPKKKPKWQKKLQQRWKKSKLGKRVRNLQAFKKKTTRKISQALKPKNIAKSKWFKNLRGGVTDLAGKGGKLLQQGGELALKVGKGVLNSLPDFNKLGKQLGGALTDAYNTSSKWVQKRFDNVVEISKALKSKYDNALKGAGQAFNNLGQKAKNALMEKILKPVMTFLEPLKKRLADIGPKIFEQLSKIPGFDKITQIFNKFGGKGSKGFLKKLGPKAIPIIGGVVNMGFAYDRLSKGDTIGGLIEGVSGILDFTGLSPVSMGLDAYMFARDFVPQIQEGEEAVIKKLGLSGFKSNIDNIFSKLPGLGEIVKMITGGDKKDDTKTTTTTIDRSNQPKTMDLLTSGKRSNIEQGLYNMRLNASKSFGGKGGSDWVGNEKYAKDVDLIMEHGLHNVIIIGGKVTLKEGYKASLKGNANNIVSTNGVSNKVSNISQYDDEEDVVVVNKGSLSQNESSDNEEKVTIIGSGGGDTSDPYANSYRGN